MNVILVVHTMNEQVEGSITRFGAQCQPESSCRAPDKKCIVAVSLSIPYKMLTLVSAFCQQFNFK